MAKLTGQFTTPRFDAENNKTHEAFLHAVVFVFTGATKVTRETDAKGKYSFDLANGEYEVSVYLKGNTEKDRFDMRAGEKFVVTSTTKEDALEKWLQVIGTGGKDELATYYENLFSQMEKVRDEFRDETSFVGNTNGKIMREGAGGWCTLASQKVPPRHDLNNRLKSGVYALPSGLSNTTDWQASGDSMLTFGWGSTFYIDLVFGTTGKIAISGTRNGRKSQWYDLYTHENTTIDSNGNIKVASPIIKLFNDRIEPNNHFFQKYEKEPIFEKLGIGVYKISNTKGLAKGDYPGDWNVEIPKDINGERYFNTEWQQLEDDTVIIRTYEREAFTEEYQRYDEEGNVLTDPKGNPLKFYKRHEINGDPVDIKEGRFIALRFLEDEEAKAKREADAIKAQEEFEEQERLKRELEEQEKTELEKRLEKYGAVLL